MVRSTVRITAAATAIAFGAVSQSVGGSSALASPSPAATTAGQSVIVVLRDQHPATPANRTYANGRRIVVGQDQDALVSRLIHRGGPHPRNVKHFLSTNALLLTVTPDQAAVLAADPSVATVIPNRRMSIPLAAAPRPVPVAGPSIVSKPAASGVCPTNPSKPLLEPEALQDTHAASDDPTAKTAQQLTDGSGTKVAFIADAIDPNNPDFIRANGEHVIIDFKSFSADGPAPAEGGREAFGDASSIAAQGLVSHDLSTFVNPASPLPTGCNIRIKGMAPGASIVALDNDFYTGSTIQAIDYAVTVDHVDVINESFGLNAIPDASTRSAISLFNDMAVAAGTTVTVSSGDAGTTSTIGNPATDPQVISVAANTNSRGNVQTGYGGARYFGNGKWVNDEISPLSSGGFTQSGSTVDITAPGDAGWAACSSRSPDCENFRGGLSDIQLFGGTSQSAPLTAGAAALVISGYRSTHGGASPSPALVKSLLTSTATDLGMPTYEQGAGLLDARAAVEAALTYPGGSGPAPAGVGSNINLSTSKITFSGAPGTPHTTTVGVRNVGTHALTVSAGGRRLVTTDVQTKSTTIRPKTDPTFINPGTGVPAAYRKLTFTVPPGTDRVAAQMIWKGREKAVASGTVPTIVRVSIFDPSGAYLVNSRPQGPAVSANYANLDLRKPTPGTYTAVIYTPATEAGYTGRVSLRTTSQRAVVVGVVTPSTLTLAPGQSQNVRVRFTVPASGGDTSYAVTFASSNGRRTAVAVVARTVVSTAGGHGTFGGSITGGNARPGAAAETFTYSFDVPAGRRDLGVGVTLRSNAGYLLEGVLVDPNDETQAIDSNLYPADFFTTGAQGLTMQLSAANPVAGRWRIVINVLNPVPGSSFQQAFTGSIAFDQSRVRTVGLPNSTNVTLPAGHATTARLQVSNTGVAPINVQVDPRASTPQNLELTSPFGPQSFELPAHAAPTFLVPPGTRKITAKAISDVPSLLELTPGLQGIDAVGDLAAAQHGSSVSVATVRENKGTVSTGVWFTDVVEIGAAGRGGQPTADAMVRLHARTPGFDPNVSSSTGDFWTAAVNPDADLGRPVTIQPGETRTITVSIRPSAPAGTKVHGVLYVYTPPSFGYQTFYTTGDALATVPYSYTVGH